MSVKEIRVGTRLYGYCGGCFGRDSYDDKRVEAIGADWLIARGDGGSVWCFTGNLDDLLEYTEPEKDWWTDD